MCKLGIPKCPIIYKKLSYRVEIRASVSCCHLTTFLIICFFLVSPSPQGERSGEGALPPPGKFFGYFNVEIPYFRGILVLTVKSQRATFCILGLGGGMAPLPPSKSAYVLTTEPPRISAWAYSSWATFLSLIVCVYRFSNFGCELRKTHHLCSSVR